MSLVILKAKMFNKIIPFPTNVQNFKIYFTGQNSAKWANFYYDCKYLLSFVQGKLANKSRN